MNVWFENRSLNDCQRVVPYWLSMAISVSNSSTDNNLLICWALTQSAEHVLGLAANVGDKMRIPLFKILQRRVYDLLANKHSLVHCFAVLCLTVIAILLLFKVTIAPLMWLISTLTALISALSHESEAKIQF